MTIVLYDNKNKKRLVVNVSRYKQMKEDIKNNFIRFYDEDRKCQTRVYFNAYARVEIYE